MDPEEENDAEIKEKFRKEIAKPYYSATYLDGFNIKKKMLNVAAIIPTYNRCPYKPGSTRAAYNPLALCIKALLIQRCLPKEIIVIDDASDDYTQEVMKALKDYTFNTKGIQIKYIKNAKRKGSSIARNIGVREAKSRYVLFLDDDCIASPYFTFGANFILRKLEKQDDRIAALVLPNFKRRTLPPKLCSLKEFGVLNLTNGDQIGNWNCFPLEYIENKEKFLDQELHILKPKQVLLSCGTALISRKKYLEVGGFPQFATWPNKYAEEAEFACRLSENGYKLFFSTDPKFHLMHGTFGGGFGEFEGDDWLEKETNDHFSLKEFCKICNIPRINTGNRVTVEEWCYSKIISFFCVVYRRNIKGAMEWIKNSYKIFVLDDDCSKLRLPLYFQPITDRAKREKIWHKAISDGLSLLLKLEEKKVKRLNRFIDSLKKRGRVEVAIRDMIYEIKLFHQLDSNNNNDNHNNSER